MIKRLVLGLSIIAPLSVSARELPTTPYLPLDIATTAAEAALKACLAKGYDVSVAVVGRDGSTKILLKADDSGPHTMTSATGKALASAALGRDTADVAELMASKPANNGIRDIDPRFVILAGGLPVRFGSNLVAGIGVGGAPSGDLDASCAEAGLKEIGATE